MRLFEGSYSFPFSWDQAAKAFWLRYPNPYSNHVLSEDVVSRRIENGKLYTKRLLIKTNKIPGWAKRFYNAKNIAILEESIVDPHGHTITSYTKNISMKNLMDVEEKVVYKESEIRGETVAERKAWIISHIYGFINMIEKLGVERFKKNTIKANLGYEHTLNHLFRSDVLENKAIQSSKFEKTKEHIKDAAQHKKEQILDVAHQKKEKIKDAARETAKKAQELTQPRNIQT